MSDEHSKSLLLRRDNFIFSIRELFNSLDDETFNYLVSSTELCLFNAKDKTIVLDIGLLGRRKKK